MTQYFPGENGPSTDKTGGVDSNDGSSLKYEIQGPYGECQRTYFERRN